jgi:uncharacterized membrane protein (DUF106 family)
MLRILLFYLGFSAYAMARSVAVPLGFQDNFWQQVQVQNIQSQLQLQSQDQFRRLLLLQDQQRQIQRLVDQQSQLENMQRNMIMHQHADQLMRISRPIKQRKP